MDPGLSETRACLYFGTDLLTVDGSIPEILPLNAFREQVQLEVPGIDPVSGEARFMTVTGPE